MQAVAEKPEKKALSEEQKQKLLKSIPIKSTEKIEGIVRRRLDEFLAGKHDYLVLKLNKANATALGDYLEKNLPGVETSLYREGEYWAVRAKRAAGAAEAPQARKANLVMPPYLAHKQGWENRYRDTEYVILAELEKTHGLNAEFAKWFNALDEIDKRGFLLYVHSEAVSDHIGKKAEYANKWDRNPAFLGKLASKYLSTHNMKELMKQYGQLSARARSNSYQFLSKNAWLQQDLGENLADFKEGLYYFFMEHKLSPDEVSRKASEFLALKDSIRRTSERTIGEKGKDLRTSPAANVSDSQIREIVSASAFGQVFYSVDSSFTLSIVLRESNFDMRRGGHGLGVTQQTTRGGHFSLVSTFWREKTNKVTGADLEMQLVSMHVLNNNVFSNVMEGVKTVGVKCAERGIDTSQIDAQTEAGIRNARRIAYAYNGSKTYAQGYAAFVSSLYRKKTFA